MSRRTLGRNSTDLLGTVSENVDRRPENNIYQLPMWPEPVRGTPNSFLRSALFSAIQGKDRRYLKGELIGAQRGTKVRYTGQQLNQGDLDVWEQVMHFAREHPLGTECFFTGHAMLRALKRSTGGSMHDWLNETLTRLNANSIEVDQDGKHYNGPLIFEFYRDDHTDRYKVVINKKLRKLYDIDAYTYIHWETRRLLRRKELASWLHGYYSSHRQPMALKVETIRTFSGSSTKRLTKFRQNLRKALTELVVVGFLKNFEIKDDDLVIVERTWQGTRQSDPSIY